MRENTSVAVPRWEWASRITSRFMPCASVPELPWHVVYTKPGREEAVERKLLDEGTPVWLPVQREGQPPPEKLFSRYLFMQMSGERLRWGYTIRTRFGEELGSVMRSGAGMPLVVPGARIAELFSLASEDGVIHLAPPRPIMEGDAATVIDGPFAGWRGLCRRTSKERIWMLLDGIGHEVAVRRADVVAG